MQKSIGLAIAVALAAASPVANATGQPARPHRPHHRHNHEHAKPRASEPYGHAGDDDSDGLSRDPDACNKGCIGGNPR